MGMNPKIFKIARDVLNEHGWHQGWYAGPSGYCVVGACGKAMAELGLIGHYSPTNFEYSEHFMALRQAVDEIAALKEFSYEVYVWNDKKGRTINEVMAVLERAEQIAEAS